MLNLRSFDPADMLTPSSVEELLAGAEPPRVWSSVSASRPPVVGAVEVRLDVLAEDALQARRIVLDAVRGLLGLDPRSTRWVADARTISVVPFPD